MKHALRITTIVAGAMFFHAPAYATVILSFGQTAGTPITATENGAQTATTLTATDATDQPSHRSRMAAPVAAFFDLSAASVGAAMPILGGSRTEIQRDVQHHQRQPAAPAPTTCRACSPT